MSIIGAGIVGVSCALCLRIAGVPVTIFDPIDPGSGCSSGNAGMLGLDSCVPLAMPGIARSIPRMLRSTDGPLGVDLTQALASAPWFFHFLRAAAPARVEEISDALNRLQVQLPACYEELLSAAKAHDLVRRVGKIHLCETERTFLETKPARDLQRSRGVGMSVLSPDEVGQLAPALTGEIHCGVFYPNARHSIDPRRMVAAFARAFTDRGGVIVRDRIRDLGIGPEGPTSLLGEAGRYPVRRLVLAAGIGAGAFARRLGAHVPMITHRGYNIMLPHYDLRLPVKSEDRKVILTPMAGGVRVTGIAEIARPTKPPTERFGRRLAEHAGALLRGGLPQASRDLWMGCRPCTPDSLPVIGPSLRFASVVFAYGHGHLGLGLGPVTGRIVSEILTGKTPLVSLDAYRPDRFVPRIRRAQPAGAES